MNTFVYFILNSSTNMMKVGISADPLSRLKQLQTGNAALLKLLGAVSGDRETEKLIHSVLGPWRAEGEWFRYTGVVQDFSQMALLKGVGVAVRALCQRGRTNKQNIYSRVSLERALRKNLGLPRAAAQKIVAGGWPALIGKHRAQDEETSEISKGYIEAISQVSIGYSKLVAPAADARLRWGLGYVRQLQAEPQQ